MKRIESILTAQARWLHAPTHKFPRQLPTRRTPPCVRPSGTHQLVCVCRPAPWREVYPESSETLH